LDVPSVKLLGYLNRLPRSSLLAIGILLVALIGILDHGSGPEISLSILYLAPICLVCWFAGTWLGVAVALVSAVAWLLADIATHGPYTHPVIPYWNTVVRLVFFSLAVVALSALRTAYRRLGVSEALRDDMTNMLVHDLKNPLVTARMAWRQIARGCEAQGGADHGTGELLRMVENSHQRMERLVSDLLDVARAEGDELPLALAPSDIQAVVRASVADAAAWRDAEELVVRAHYEPEAVIVTIDADKVRRVVDNLLANAIRFTPAGGRVEVLVSRRDGEVYVTVRDTGKGIPRELQERIFDKFSQVEAQRGGQRMSVGLGLAFCRLVVEAHGGRIWVESSPGEGSAFTFALPIEQNGARAT
jgi:signal transduction histidine kinase